MVSHPCRGIAGQPCPDAAILVGAARRCSSCATADNTAHRNPIYDSAWRRLSKRMVAEWIREHGPWCPGDPPEHDAHPSFDLTVDHGEQAGVPTRLLDRSRLRVMCRWWNAVLGGRRKHE